MIPVQKFLFSFHNAPLHNCEVVWTVCFAVDIKDFKGVGSGVWMDKCPGETGSCNRGSQGSRAGLNKQRVACRLSLRLAADKSA